MTNMSVWFCMLVVGLVAVSAEVTIDGEIKPVVMPDKGPLLINFQVEKAEKKSDSLPMVPLTRAENAPVALVDPQPTEEEESELLQPIGPIFPAYLKPNHRSFPFFKSLAFNKLSEHENSDDQGEQPKRGILTIILIKSHKSDGSDAEMSAKINTDDFVKSGSQLSQFKDDLFDKAGEKLNTLTNFIMHDLFGKKEEDETKKTQLLLGGPSDPDHFFNFEHLPSFEEIEQQQDNEDNKFESFLRLNGNEPIMSDDIGYMSDPIGHDRKKSCNLMRFMKLKASVYYNTIVHLLFISGIILITLLMVVLTLRINKRRNALRYYAKSNMNVSSVDSALAKQKEAEAQPGSRRLFRLGNLRTSYEQRIVPSLLLNAPPAYDQINATEAAKPVKSSLIKSLASAYKSRYERLTGGQNQPRDEDVSSLPAYDEKLKSSNQTNKN